MTWKELESVLFDIEVTFNNRPLGYIEDDIHTPILTPNFIIPGQPNFWLEGDVNNTEDCDLKKRAKYIRSCKDRVRSRWTKEYLRGNNSKKLKLMVGYLVTIRSNEKNRAHWKTRIVHQLLPGQDSITKAVKLRAGKSYLERAVQHLYQLELKCHKKLIKRTNKNQLDVNAKEFRHRRNAAAIAVVKVNGQIKNEREVPNIK